MQKSWACAGHVMAYLVLAGCAVQDVSSEPGGGVQAVAIAQRSEAADKPSAPILAPAKPAEHALPLSSPSTLSFAENETELPVGQRETIARIAAEAGPSARFVLTGQADRATAVNAREVAIARAAAVREALRGAGIGSKQVRIKYSTAQPKHGVLVQWAR